MRKSVKRALICGMTLVLLVFGCSFSYPSDSYSITYGNDAVLSAEAVKFGRTITGVDLGIGGFKDPMCVRCAPDGRLLIADTGNHRVVVTDSDYRVQFLLQTFTFPIKAIFLSEDNGRTASSFFKRTIHSSSTRRAIS